jgi:probable phosphoglycerate mutase
VKQLYFIRHGLSEFNKSHRWAGTSDTPLAPEGHDQAKSAGLKAKKEGLAFDIVISSPLQRAHDTAKHVAHHVDYPQDKIVVSDAVIERNYGALEGKRSLKDGVKYYIDESSIDHVENIETLEQLQARADQFLEYLHTLDHDTVLVVSHGAFGRALWRSVHKKPITYRDKRFQNAKMEKFI